MRRARRLRKGDSFFAGPATVSVPRSSGTLVAGSASSVGFSSNWFLISVTASRLGFSNYFLNQLGGGVTDDHVYPNRILSIPSIDIININPSTLRFAPHWHTHADNMDVIDRNTLKAVGQTLLEVIFSEEAI